MISPGVLFLAKYGVPGDSSDINRYVDFLRKEAGVQLTPPIDLNKIYAKFQIPQPALEHIDQEGLLLDAERGLIIINEDDPRTRRRFSEAHELIELLFSVLPRGEGFRSTISEISNHT